MGDGDGDGDGDSGDGDGDVVVMILVLVLAGIVAGCQITQPPISVLSELVGCFRHDRNLYARIHPSH